MRAVEIRLRVVLNSRLDEGFFENKTERLEKATDCAITSLQSVFSDIDENVEVVRSEIDGNIVNLKININCDCNSSISDSEKLELIRSSFKDGENKYHDEFLIVDYDDI
ncbi:hypothetical protein [Psychrobacter sp. Ps3]|uniref:hypothetical protein n=1 Tax=Psychrobacter sp. Ps3 TaxID=2790957 RepID=UPI001EDCC7F7|nr:hypothetical protein [Psychrobacter sp. Ps3]MCG3882086.1 hypothetical protein [Psychrobacter sp. Ps3]